MEIFYCNHLHKHIYCTLYSGVWFTAWLYREPVYARHVEWLSEYTSSTQLVYSARHSEHITPICRDLRWLRMPEWIQFCLGVLTFSTAWPSLTLLSETDAECHSCLLLSIIMIIIVGNNQLKLFHASDILHWATEHSLSPRHSSWVEQSAVSYTCFNISHHLPSELKTFLYHLTEHFHVFCDCKLLLQRFAIVTMIIIIITTRTDWCWKHFWPTLSSLVGSWHWVALHHFIFTKFYVL